MRRLSDQRSPATGAIHNAFKGGTSSIIDAFNEIESLFDAVDVTTNVAPVAPSTTSNVGRVLDFLDDEGS
jgi:hypothetical protein